MKLPVWKYDINRDREDLPTWDVVFTGDFAAIMASIRANSKREARNFLVDYYDINLDSFKAEATLTYGEGEDGG